MYFIRRHSRRDFVKNASIALAGHRSRWLQVAAPANQIDLRDCVLVTSQNPTLREMKALTVLAEEAAKRSGLAWQVQSFKILPRVAVIDVDDKWLHQKTPQSPCFGM